MVPEFCITLGNVNVYCDIDSICVGAGVPTHGCTALGTLRALSDSAGTLIQGKDDLVKQLGDHY